MAPDVLAVDDLMNDLIVENSLIGDTTGSGISVTTGTGNILNQSALLGPLADHGGPTQTHALLLGSPAIDAGNDALAVDVDGIALATDQRGGTSTRSFDDLTATGTGVDIGAFERHAFLVDNQIDEDDGNHGVGDLSLREAIDLASSDRAFVTITFDASVFTGGDDSVIRLTQGELDIRDSMSIDGTSVGGVVITGDANDDDVTLPGTNITDVSASLGGIAGAPDDLLDDNSRVINFSDTTGNLTLTNLQITGGRTRFTFRSGGGGIRSNSSGDLTLNSSNVSGNSTAGNKSPGGGIYSSQGDVFLTNSSIYGNSTTGDGDGPFRAGSGGGGIYTDLGSVFLTNSSVIENSTSGDFSAGGGIHSVFGIISLSNSTVSGNSTAGYRSEGGGIHSSTAIADISLLNSTVSGNNTAGESSSGGGIFSAFGGISLRNSTVSGNSTANDVYSHGGGVFGGYSPVVIVNSTVTGNSSASAGGGIGFFQRESSFSFADQRLTLINSIVAGNTDNGTAPDLRAAFDFANDQIVENSLIGDTTGSEITAATGIGNILDQPAFLAALADNGGPTETHALLPGSPAIGAGSNALAVNENGNPLTTDQRGEARIGAGTVDMGAVESEFVNPFLLGDVNQNGVVNFLDIQPLISLLSSNGYLDEADIDRDGDVDFLDIQPLISLLSGTTVTPPPLLGDVNLNGVVNFLDIQPFISLLSSNSYLDEADIDRDGGVDFLDIQPFISLLSGTTVTPLPLLGDADLSGVVNFLDIEPFISLLSSDSYLDEADIDRDGDVDFLDINPFIGELSSAGTVETPQPEIAQPVIAQPVNFDLVSVAPAVLPVFAPIQTSPSISVLSNSSTAVAPVEQPLFVSEVLDDSPSVSERSLWDAQAIVGVIGESMSLSKSSDAADLAAPLAENSPLELAGAHELLDSVFSGELGDVEDVTAGDPDEFSAVDFSDAWLWPSSA